MKSFNFKSATNTKEAAKLASGRATFLAGGISRIKLNQPNNYNALSSQMIKSLIGIFKSLNNIDYSLVFFIPVQKINFYIDQFKKYFSDRKIVIAREMTKIHEEFIRSSVKIIKNLSEPTKGEITIVLSEKIKEKKSKEEIDESVKIEIRRMIKKYTHKDVVEFISKKENLKKKLIYEYCLKLKKLK